MKVAIPLETTPNHRLESLYRAFRPGRDDGGTAVLHVAGAITKRKKMSALVFEEGSIGHPRVTLVDEEIRGAIEEGVARPTRIDLRRGDFHVALVPADDVRKLRRAGFATGAVALNRVVREVAMN